MSVEQRKVWAATHASRLKAALDTKPPRETPQRIFRTRIWADDLIVVTLIQNISVTPGPGQPDIKLHLFVTRPYTTPSTNGGTVVNMALAGQYSMEEVVAFLALDKIDPDSLEWVDETKYSNLLVVGDISKLLH